MVMMVRKCCCRWSLKNGAIIIGVINALGGLGYVIGGTIEAAGPRNYGYYENEVIGLNTMVAVLGGIMLLVAFWLIVGAMNGNPGLLMPWMGYTLVFLVVNTGLLMFIGLIQIEGFLPLGVLAFIGIIICILLEVYFLIVVYSLYRELKGTAPPNRA